MSNKIIYIIAVVGVAVAGGVFITNKNSVEPVACTEEAKLCPDGSYVGRVGPKCEFKECPSGSSSGSETIEVKINQSISALGVGIIPLEVLEDSRCPVDVQCIQAGTVRLRVSLSSGLGKADQIFSLGRMITTEVEEVTLSGVSPAPHSKQTIGKDDYVFSFTIKKREVADETGASGVTGKVLLGPTCPVMRDPPDPNCADRPYETTIQVIEVGSPKSLPFATVKSDKEGKYYIALPPGRYSLQAVGGSVMPRCETRDVTVVSSKILEVNLSCDSGIR